MQAPKRMIYIIRGMIFFIVQINLQIPKGFDFFENLIQWRA